jgi:hypothetical protein
MRVNYPDAWTSYPGVMPATTSGSVYNNNQVIYPFDMPYLSSRSRANGDFVAEAPRIGHDRKCMFSCNNPSSIDLIGAVANGNLARYY